MTNWKPIAVAAGAAAAVALVGAVTTEIGPWYYSLRKPSWQPPDWLFGPAWTVIFALTALAGVLAWNATDETGGRERLLAAFAANGLLNVLWSTLFFARRRPDWALAEVVPLWLSIVVLLIVVTPVSRLGGAALVPYLLWVSFAAYLNLTIVRLNGPFTA